MAGTVGFTDGTTTSVNITTNGSGNVNITISPNKPDGTPNTAVPPSISVNGPGQMPNPAPGPGEKTGTFVVPVGDPLFAIIDCQANCTVVISLFGNATGAGTPIAQYTLPNQIDINKIILVALLKQAALDVPKAKPVVVPPAAKADAPVAPKAP